ncbi:MAG: zinc ribbon domain-containing protein [Candidatus Thorarchaeota archaeon]
MMRNKKIILLYLFLIITLNFAILPIIFADDDDYDVGFDENTVIVWRCETAKEYYLEQFYAIVEDYDFEYLDIEEEDKIKFEIRSITEYDDYYTVYFTFFEGKDLDDSDNKGIYSETISKDPEDLIESWLYGEEFETSILFILTDTKDYLKELNENIPQIFQIAAYATCTTLVLNGTAIGFPYWITIRFNDDGILDRLELYYEKMLIYEIELRSVKPSENYFVIILLVIVITSIIAVIVAIIVVLIYLHQKSARSERELPQIPHDEVIISEPVQKPIETSILKKEYVKKYCTYCGNKRETGDNFCIFCGKKL